MKKGIFLSMLLMFALTLNIGCGALDVTEDVTFDITLQVVSATPQFNVEEILRADSLSDVIDQYSSLIKDIQLLEVTFQITEVGSTNSATKINSATLTIADESGAGEKTIATISNQDIAVLPTPFPLPLDQEGITRFEDLIEADPHSGLVKVSGSTDGAPVDFTVKFVFKVKMTASPL